MSGLIHWLAVGNLVIGGLNAGMALLLTRQPDRFAVACVATICVTLGALFA